MSFSTEEVKSLFPWRLFNPAINLLLVFIFILSPSQFQQLAQADIQYADLDTTTWATADTAISYAYDANGSLIEKITWNGSIGSTKTEEQHYEYNLQNRLARVRTDTTPSDTTDWEKVIDYEYNTSGIRIAKRHYEATFAANGTIIATRNDGNETEKTTLYLTDPTNHTGYAQTIAELTYADTTTPNPATDTPTSTRTYAIADDVLTQTNNAADPQYLLYDGQGSTRQLRTSGRYCFGCTWQMAGGLTSMLTMIQWVAGLSTALPSTTLKEALSQ